MRLGITKELFLSSLSFFFSSLQSHPDTHNLIGHVLFYSWGDGESFCEDVSSLKINKQQPKQTWFYALSLSCHRGKYTVNNNNDNITSSRKQLLIIMMIWEHIQHPIIYSTRIQKEPVRSWEFLDHRNGAANYNVQCSVLQKHLNDSKELLRNLMSLGPRAEFFINKFEKKVIQSRTNRLTRFIRRCMPDASSMSCQKKSKAHLKLFCLHLTKETKDTWPAMAQFLQPVKACGWEIGRESRQ